MEVGAMTTTITLNKGPRYHLTEHGELVIELRTDQELMDIFEQSITDDLRTALLRRFGERAAQRIVDEMAATLHAEVSREVLADLIQR